MNKDYPFNNIEEWITNFRERDEKTVQEFFHFSLPVRFHLYWLLEFGTEESFREAMTNSNYNYLPMLQQVKQRMPAEFYKYFNDLLMEEEFERYEAAFLRSLQGIFDKL